MRLFTHVSVLALTVGLLSSPTTAQEVTQTFSGPTGPNIVQAPQPIGQQGFTISIGTAVDTVSTPQGEAIAAENAGRLLEQAGVGVRFDRLGATPKLAIITTDMVDAAKPGTALQFQAQSNYPAWIEQATVVIKDARTNATLATLPIAPNGYATWQTPKFETQVYYYLEVRDGANNRDTTQSRRLAILNTAAQPEPSIERRIQLLETDMSQSRQIPVRGGAVLVTGQDMPEGTTLDVFGETVQVAPMRAFQIERILPPGVHEVTITGKTPGKIDQLQETIDIPKSDWFYTAMVDITLGRSWQQGRIAGFAQGVTANGTRITASIDTNERDLDELFDDFFERDAQRLLRSIDPTEPFLTYGDDSRREDLAPTSGRLYGRAEQDRWYAQWGDFTSDPLLEGLARTNRTLYGASGAWESLAKTESGNPRIKAAGYAATAETASQRDVFRATGASAYFLSRRDITEDSERVRVEIRDKITGQVKEERTLQPGTDYRFNPIQGTVFLREAIVDPNNQTEAYLVVAYEYIPVGGTDGLIAGGRIEGWVQDTVRIGVEGQLDTSTGPDTQVIGADILYQPTERSSILLGIAQSEGPGMGQSISDNGGLNLNQQNPVGGSASAYRLEGRLDLEDIGQTPGTIDIFLSKEEEGFASPDGVVDADRTRGSVEGTVTMARETKLSFGARFDDIEGGLKESDIFVGLRFGDELRYTEIGVRHEERKGVGTDLGHRTQVEARYTAEISDATTWWIYGQATVDRQGWRDDNRVGAGVETRLNDNMKLLADVSYGTSGPGAEIGISDTTQTGTRRLSYRLDPNRQFDTIGFGGSDRGVFVVSGDTKLSETFSQQAETRYDAFGNEPSMTTNYGLTWTPSKKWSHELGLITGSARASNGIEREKTGISLGTRFNNEGRSFALRGEWVKDRSDTPLDPDTNFDTFVLRASGNIKTSENWHLLGSLDAVYTESAVPGGDDGRFVEGKIGYAYRPTHSDKTIGLVSYTFLDDRPANGQRNFDGTTNGPGQQSHILNANLTQELSEDWTLGLKYGLRHRTLYPSVGASETSISHLAIVRFDYHLTHEWDALVEGRAMWHNNDSEEYRALVGVTRAINENLRLGVGYGWGTVSDDLRTVAPEKDGLFLNITASF